MGGSSHQIFGELHERRLWPTLLPRTFMDRLLFRYPTIGPATHDMGTHTMIELRAHELAPLKDHFLAFLRDRCPEPSAATEWVMGYIPSATSIHVRGEQRRDEQETKWYVQIGFSGSAGMTEVSAAVAAHWAQIWHREQVESMGREILIPWGFTPAPPGDEKPEKPPVYVPTDDAGYALFHPQAQRAADSFEIDRSFVEGAQDHAAAIIKTLRSRHLASLKEDRSCRCQLCSG